MGNSAVGGHMEASGSARLAVGDKVWVGSWQRVGTCVINGS
jgi:hypothetical protein